MTKYVLPVYFGRVFTYHFTYIPFFSLRLYLVLAESNVNNSSSQNDLHCGL